MIPAAEHSALSSPALEKSDLPSRACGRGAGVRVQCAASALLASAGLLLSACSIQPWVKPYERERLADPIMQLSGDPLADKHREHVYDVREGARGATGVQGGGCGCN